MQLSIVLDIEPIWFKNMCLANCNTDLVIWSLLPNQLRKTHSKTATDKKLSPPTLTPPQLISEYFMKIFIFIIIIINSHLLIFMLVLIVLQIETVKKELDLVASLFDISVYT